MLKREFPAKYVYKLCCFFSSFSTVFCFSSQKGTYNMIVEIPRWTNAKLEVGVIVNKLLENQTAFL